MAKAGMRNINNYVVETFENGDLLITEKRRSILRIVIFLIATGFCMYMAIKTTDDWQYAYAFGFFLFLGVTVFDVWSYFRPQRVFISKERDVIEYSNMRGSGVLTAKEIRYFKYWHESVHTTTTGSIIGAGPKAHIQGIQVMLQNGSDILILPLKTQHTFTQGEEQDEGQELMKAIQRAFRSYVECM